MDVNLLAVSVGNSRVALGTFVRGELVAAERFGLDDAAGIAAATGRAWAHFDETAQAEVCGASVNPIAQERIEHALTERTGKSVQWVGREIDVPIVVKTEQPGQTGVDRVLNVAAAFEQMEKACVVVDAGTALTVSVCDEKGAFLGGAIAPGVRLMLESLNEHTARLPLVTAARPAGPVGRTTEEAVRVGVVTGLRGLMKEIVEGFAEQLGNWPDMICTGGDAQLLFGDWEFVHAVSPDLTLYGIALAYTEHNIKHES